MAGRISKLAPPAALKAPDAETREQGLKALRLELEAEEDVSNQALLLHEIARCHELRDDLAAAARDELAATKLSAGFVEPLEALIDIAIRSRSKTNLSKLLGRLFKLARSPEEKERAALASAMTSLSSDEPELAKAALLEGLESSPESSALWLALEGVAVRTSDLGLRLRATTGRAAHAASTELRGLLFERVARLQQLSGDVEGAFASLHQSIDEVPTYRTLNAWEQLAVELEDFGQALEAATQMATILQGACEIPEEATLYQVPPQELLQNRVAAAQIRAISYALILEDEKRARALGEQLVELAPKSKLAWALLAELCRRQAEPEAALRSVSRLIEVAGGSEQDQAVLRCLGAIQAQEAGETGAQDEFLNQLRKFDAVTLLPHARVWESAEAEGDVEALLEVLSAMGGEDGLRDFSLSRALLHLVSGKPAHALPELDRYEASLDKYEASLSGDRQSALPDGDGTGGAKVAIHLSLALRRLAAELSGDRETFARENDRLADSLSDGSERTGLKWESLRLRLTSGENPSDVGAIPGDDAWARLALAALCLPNSSALKQAVEQCREQASPGSPATAALNLFWLASFGGHDSLEAQSRDPDQGPLVASALVSFRLRTASRLESSQNTASGPKAASGKLRAARANAANVTQDPVLKASWLLRNAASSLKDGKLSEAQGLLEQEGLFDSETLTLLRPWFSAGILAGDPVQTLEFWQQTASPKMDRRLEYAALTYRLLPEQLENVWVEPLTEPEQILRILSAANISEEALDYALQSSQLFDKTQRAALAFARPLLKADSSDLSRDAELSRAAELSKAAELSRAAELLTAAERLSRAAPSATTELLRLVAARRATDRKAESQALLQLGQRANSAALLTAVERRFLLQDDVAALDASLAQSDLWTSTEDRAAIAWTRLEEVDGPLCHDHAARAAELARCLDESLEDPDAQAAMLVAAYDYLMLQDFEKALELFEPLRRILPSDLAICHGTRLAAEKLGRVDLEAPTTRELAQTAADNRTSARLWERAGVLYQDHLSAPEEAEVCFNAALARSPGSAIAFERIYRIARAKNDRQRLVELLDARIDSADTETLLVELYWEKARYCRMLGRRAVALRATEELLKLAPDHLPSLALSAELHLVDARRAAAAEALRAVAKHPDTPTRERTSAGLFACDLFEQEGRHRDAVELLQDLESHGMSGAAGLERRARALARTEDFGEAYKAYAELHRNQDTIGARLHSARIMLAIQRDHLKEPEDLKEAARSVLRDAPFDPDAVDVVLAQNFSADERRHLLAPARKELRRELRANPLNPESIRKFALLCEACGDDGLERVALGNLGLTGRLPDQQQERLDQLRGRCPAMPSYPWSEADLKVASDPAQLDARGAYLRLLSPYIAAEIEPSLEGLGVSSLMRVDEFSGDALRSEVGTWMAAFGGGDFELYVGGTDPQMIRAIDGEMPTVLLGKDISSPLMPKDRARLSAQLGALRQGMATLINHPPQVLATWIAAAALATHKRASRGSDPLLDEMALNLSRRMPAEVQAELTRLGEELDQAGVNLSGAPSAALRGAALCAVLAYGDSSVMRLTPDLMPEEAEERTQFLSDLVRFVLTDEFFNLRKKAGLEGA